MVAGSPDSFFHDHGEYPNGSKYGMLSTAVNVQVEELLVESCISTGRMSSNLPLLNILIFFFFN